VHAQTLPQALEAITQFSPPYVIKEDGLAAGKGVTVAPTLPEAHHAIHAAFEKGMTVVLEAFLPGQEISVLAICDGTHAIPLATAQDFKRAYDDNAGPNTGGMGAYAPVPWATPDLMHTVQTRILQPVLQAMADRGTPYTGVLYAGLMIGPDGQPSVVEFNARFGDPETQVVLPLLAEDLVLVLQAAAQHNLGPWVQTGLAQVANIHAVTVVLAAQGYPGAFQRQQPITLPTITDEASQLIFHAGVSQATDAAAELQTDGGRVLSLVGLGSSLPHARQQAYMLADQPVFAGQQYRTDVAAAACRLTVAPI
jgi:phosphoribosylamine---glycine ligase